MRQFAKIHSLCLILLILFGVSACNDDLGVGTGTVKEGVPTTISLNLSTNSQTVQSRVEQPGETEYNVSSVYLFAFNSNGDKTGGQAFDSQSGGLTGTYRNNSFTGTLNGFNVLSGSNQTLYALVNYDNANFTLSKSLDEINHIGDLENLTVQIADGRITLNRYSFFMLGKKDGVTVTEGGEVTADGGGKVTLQMERLDAKITFKINTSIEGAISGTVKFIPKSFLVKQLPLSARVVEAEENSSDIIYKSMTEDMKVTNFDKVGETESSFTFYMFENRVAPPDKGADGGSGKWIDATEWIDATTEPATYKAESMYALREKEVKKTLEGGEDAAHPGMTEQNTGDYVYAPEYATFVEITGELSYERRNEGVTEYVNVSARYTIHLGETGTASNRNVEKFVNNYMVKRNTHYTYTITLTGINSYQAEVWSDQEKRPGMEGDVIIAGDQVKAIDSHYARTRIKFTRSALKEGLSWIVQTPFDKGMKLYTSDENSIKDYKWILFAVNKEFGLDKNGTNSPNNSNMVKFPGYDAYDGGASTLNTQTNASNDEGNGTFNGKGIWKNRMSTDAYYYQYKDYLSDDACLRDVNQLINHLKAQAESSTSKIFETDGNEEVVYVTAFVDEYMYNYDPRTEEYQAPVAGITDSERLLLWKEVVNGSERMMHICVKGAQYSPDGDTSWSNSVVTFRQTPIYSMYDASKVESAWGTESILETGPLSATTSHTPSYTLTMNNGRKNTLAFFVNQDGATNGTNWTTVLSRDAADVEGGEDELNVGYQNTWYACMTRNRDLDGDNVIDPEEVRWCLASIDELTDLWIGENALPQTAKLYKGNGTYMEHMASSSGAEDTPWIIWAEEGASRGQYNDGSYNKSNYTYRCIRYLGISLDNVDATPTDYVQVTSATPEVPSYGTSYRIDVSRLSNAAKRDLQDSGHELPVHYERGTDYLNMPYTAFEVLVTPHEQGAVSRYWNGSNDITGFKDMINSGGVSKLCPEGYRIPNQRELLLMLTSLSSIGWQGSYWSSTKFSYSNEGIFGFRPGFATSDSNLILVNPSGVWDNVSGRVRCVRDVK